MNKKNGFIALLLLAVMMFVAACGNEKDGSTEPEKDTGKETSGEETTIEFWTMQLQPTFTDYIQGVIDDFEEQNPTIKIDWLDVPAADLDKKILTAVSSKTAPDVVNLNPTLHLVLQVLMHLSIWMKH